MSSRTHPPRCLMFLALLLWAVPLTLAAAEPPSDEQIHALRAALTEHLDQDVLPYWTAEHPEDPARQGFLVHLDAFPPAGQSGPVHLKPLIPQLRLLYVYDVAAGRARDPERRQALLQRSEQQYHRITELFWDANGGWYGELDANLQPTGKTLKPTIAQIYAIYVLSSIQQEPLRSKALQQAVLTFDHLDRTGWDPRYGGYLESYTLPIDHPDNRYKQTGTNFHALQALTALHQATGDMTHRRRLEALIRLTTTYALDPQSKEAYVLLARDWSPIDPAAHPTARRTIYGHTVEMVWYTLDGLEALGGASGELATWANRLADGFLRDGMGAAGNVHHYGQLGGQIESRKVYWWAQAEAMTMCLQLYELTGDPRYWHDFMTIHDWTFTHLVPAGSGGWIPLTDPEGRPLEDASANTQWKAGLHVTRFLLKSEQILERLEAQQEYPHDVPQSRP